ncbi:MAG: C25 family cysteine peptidase [Planctomycetota bacterium]|nr:C25 family cysteine peptidase [Planctomycetota bacterium]
MGVDSQGGAHPWSNNWGDRAGVDTWAYYPSNAVTLAGGISVREADLSVTKTHAPAAVSRGNQIVYTVTVHNAGPSDVVGASFLDDVPAGIAGVTWTSAVTQGSGASSPPSGSGNAVSASVDLSNGGTIVYTIVGTIDTSALGSLRNTAYILRPFDVTDQNDLFRVGAGNNSASDSIPVADLRLSKATDTAAPAVGATFNYTVRVYNDGPDTATGVVVQDVLPPGVTVSTGPPPIPPVATAGTWGTATGTSTLNYTAAAGNNRLLVYVISFEENGSSSAPVLNGVSYGGVAMVRAEQALLDQGNPESGVQVWYLADSSIPSGANNFVLNWGNDPNEDRIQQAAITLVNVNQTSPIRSTSANTGTGTGITTGNFAVQVGDLALAAISAGDDGNGPWTINTAGYSPAQLDVQYANEIRTGVFARSIATAGNENPSFTFNGTPIRQAIVGVAFAQVPAPVAAVSVLDNWGSALGNNTLNYTAAAGSNRALIYALAVEDTGSGTPNLSQVRYGGILMQRAANRLVNANGGENLIEIWYLLEASIPSGSNAFALTWTTAPNDADRFAQGAVTLGGVDQSSPVRASSTNTSTSATVNTGNFAVDAGDIALVGISSGDDGNGNYTMASGYALGVDDEADNTMRIGAFTRAVTASGNENPTFTFNGTPNRQASAGVSFRAQPIPSGPAVTQGSTSQAGQTITWNVGSLAAGASATLTIPVTNDNGLAKTNVAQVTASNQYDEDSIPNNGVATEDDQASVTTNGGTVDLSVAVAASNPTPEVGQQVTFTITLNSAAGGTDSGNTTVSAPLPAGIDYDSSVPAQGSYDPATGIWDVGTMPANASRVLTVTGTVATTGAKTLTAQVANTLLPDVDSTPNNNVPTEDDQASVTVTPGLIDLSLTETVSNPTPVLGTDVVLTLTLRNDGPNTATGVTVRGTLPEGLVLVSATGTGGSSYSTATGNGIWTVGTLNSGGVVTLQITATMTVAKRVEHYSEVFTANQLDSDSTPWNGNFLEDDWAAVLITGGPNALPVTLGRFVAREDAGGALVEWLALTEIENVGFHLWRRAALPGDAGEPDFAGGETAGEAPPAPEGAGRTLPALTAPGEWVDAGWERVTPRLIAGRLSSPSAKVYRWFDDPAPGEYEYALETLSLSGRRQWHRWATPPVRVSARAAEEAPASPEAVEALFERVAAGFEALRHERVVADLRRVGRDLQTANVEVLAEARAAGSETATAGASSRDADTPAAASDLPGYSAEVLSTKFVRPPSNGYDAAKALARGKGVLLLEQDDLPAGYDLGKLKPLYEGRNLRALATTDAGGLVFYAPGYEDAYTDKDAWMLQSTRGRTSAGRELKARNLFRPGRMAATAAPAHASLRLEQVYFAFSKKPLVYQPYFSNKFLTDGTTHDFSLATPYALPGGGVTLALTVYSQSASDSADPDHELQVSLNGTPLGVARWDGDRRTLRLVFNVPVGAIRADAPNTITLHTPDLPDVDQLAFLYEIEIDYSRELRGGEPIEIESGVRGLVELADLPTDRLWVVDARNLSAPRLVAYETEAQGDGNFRARFTAMPNGRGHGYYVVPQGAELSPLAVVEARVEPLASRIDYLATGPAQFGPSIQPLLDRRAEEGLTTRFVDQQVLMDSYNHGRYGPGGLYRALFAARPRPRFLCLLGHTTSDYKDKLAPFGIDPLCPTILASSSLYSEIPGDPAYGDFGRGPELAVGRFPVKTPAQLDVAVQRTLAFIPIQGQSGAAGALVADRLDLEAGDFAAESDVLAETRPDIEWAKLYLGVNYPNAASLTSDLAVQATQFANLVIFTGHGASFQLSKENVLDGNKAKAWRGNCVFLPGTCTANYFMHDLAVLDTLPELLLIQPQGGISASIASSTYTSIHSLAIFQKLLLEEARPGRTWGEALKAAQLRARDLSKGDASYAEHLGDLVYGECLLGDPALPIYAP